MNFIWGGVSNGTSGLNLTIADGNGNVLAQSKAYMQIVDIKQMYERWTVGDDSTNPPASTPTLVTDGLAPSVPGFQYAAPTDPNTPYILHVHGFNMETWVPRMVPTVLLRAALLAGSQRIGGDIRFVTS